MSGNSRCYINNEGNKPWFPWSFVVFFYALILLFIALFHVVLSFGLQSDQIMLLCTFLSQVNHPCCQCLIEYITSLISGHDLPYTKGLKIHRNSLIWAHPPIRLLRLLLICSIAACVDDNAVPVRGSRDVSSNFSSFATSNDIASTFRMKCVGCKTIFRRVP